MTLSRKAALGLAVSSAAALIAAGAGSAQAAGDYYGSLALGETPSASYVGGAWNYKNWDDSDRDAIKECGRGECRVVVRFANGCGAVAKSSDNKHGWAYGANKAEAERKAIEALGPLAPPFPNFGSSAPKTAKILMSECTINAG